MIIVTGGAGFIGSNLVKGLNDRSLNDILIVDNLTRGEKCKNLNALKFNEYIDKHDFIRQIELGSTSWGKIDAVFHDGACSNTMEYNGKYMLENNYEYSKKLLHYCLEHKIPYIYASSASVYGNGDNGFIEEDKCENVLNVYAFSKLIFDRYVRRVLPHAKSQIVGLRYFNVFGPQETHKERMASVAYHFYNQIMKDGTVRLFKGIDGYADGEQKRDFIYVKDVVNVNMYFLDNPNKSGIFNCGTGKARTFNDIAKALFKVCETGKIEYVDFPEVLKGKYQSFTQADVTKLSEVGYQGGFTEIESAIEDYCYYLKKNNGYLV